MQKACDYKDAGAVKFNWIGARTKEKVAFYKRINDTHYHGKLIWGAPASRGGECRGPYFMFQTTHRTNESVGGLGSTKRLKHLR